MKETIMIVDDEREIADLLEVYLLNDGYQVYKFYNGTDFQNQLKKIRVGDQEEAREEQK